MSQLPEVNGDDENVENDEVDNDNQQDESGVEVENDDDQEEDAGYT